MTRTGYVQRPDCRIALGNHPAVGEEDHVLGQGVGMREEEGEERSVVGQGERAEIGRLEPVFSAAIGTSRHLDLYS